MKKLDFINLVTTYASHFRDKFKKTSVDKTLTDFVNYIAADQGVDYGIRAEELEKHKRRKYNPQDSDVIINMCHQISDLNKTLETIYINTDHPMIKASIEHMGEKYGGDLERSIIIHK